MSLSQSGATELERLRSAVWLAIAGFETLIDPDPQHGILTYVKLQGEQQGVSLDATYDAVVDLVAALKTELGDWTPAVAIRRQLPDELREVADGLRRIEANYALIQKAREREFSE